MGYVWPPSILESSKMLKKVVFLIFGLAFLYLGVILVFPGLYLSASKSSSCDTILRTVNSEEASRELIDLALTIADNQVLLDSLKRNQYLSSDLRKSVFKQIGFNWRLIGASINTVYIAPTGIWTREHQGFSVGQIRSLRFHNGRDYVSVKIDESVEGTFEPREREKALVINDSLTVYCA